MKDHSAMESPTTAEFDPRRRSKFLRRKPSAVTTKRQWKGKYWLGIGNAVRGRKEGGREGAPLALALFK